MMNMNKRKTPGNAGNNKKLFVKDNTVITCGNQLGGANDGGEGHGSGDGGAAHSGNIK
jgi:hypothetical protein